MSPPLTQHWSTSHTDHTLTGKITTLTIRMKVTQRQSTVISSKPDYMSKWAGETESLQAPWVVKVGLLLSLQQRGEGGWRGGCKDHFYKLQHSFIITNFSNQTKISSIKWAAAKQIGRCIFRWAELTHYTCRKLDITSKADPQNCFLSSVSISPTLIASSIWPSAMLAGWPRTGAAPGPRLSLITETRDGKTYKLLPPFSDHASAHNSASHANIMLYMLHHTTE